ncbi:MAG: histidinol-phosphatase [Alphaproteobacteria bacterium]|nr:histidinol-phosphatase [Alphaproteobacteria bacterium]
MPSAADLADLRAFADDLADAARAVILPHFRSDVAVTVKDGPRGGFDPVTVADRAAEETIRRLIEARFPDHGIIGEEFGMKPAASPYSWVLDPIDGTRAFIAGLPLWGVLIALTYDGKPVLGIIDQPYIGERFTGWIADHDRGAALTTASGVRALKTRACARLTDAVVATTDATLFDGAEAGGFEQVRQTAKLARYGCDCYAYAMVALGGVDLVIESGLAPWDVAALAPVIAGAGGEITDWRGRALDPDFFANASARAQIIAAGDPRPRDEALVALRRAAKSGEAR